MSSRKKLPKSLSLSSVRSPELKDMVMDDVAEASESLPHYFQSMTKYTLRIVNLQQFPDEFARFLKENLVDEDTEEDLIKASAINWCRTVKDLYPLKTRGDGNCLLHAVSLAMWGIHDSSAFLRRLVLVSLVSDGQKGGGRIFRRWKRSRVNFNQNALVGGIQLDSREWDAEWQEVITAASDIKGPPSRKNAMLDFLEDIHVFALANILRRPIIILSDSQIRSLTGAVFSANQFSGLYLPLLWPHKSCVKSPIVLGYANNHFTPLVGMEDDSMDETGDMRQKVVPLVTKDLVSLNIHFLTEKDEKNVFQLLKNYLNVKEINWTCSDASIHFLPCAKLDYKKLEGFYLMRDYFLSLQKVFKEQKLNQDKYWYNWNDEIDLTKPKSWTKKSLDLQLEECDRERFTEPKRDVSNNESHEEKIVNISTQDTKTCADNRCQNTALAKYFPYCIHHKRKRSNSTSSIESVSPILNEHMSELNIENTPKRNSLNGKQENLNITSRPCEEIGCNFYGLEEWGNRCSEHRQKPGAISLKRTSITDSSWHKCRSSDKDCKGQGHSRYKGQCEKCFLKPCDREDLPDMEILGMLPGKHLVGKHQAQVLQKCKYEDCKQISTKSTLGYCSDHFILLYRRGVLDIPTQDQVLQYRDEMEESIQEAEPEREVRPPVMTQPQDYLCSTPGCEGIKCRNPEGLCFECSDKGRPENSRKKLERQESIEEMEQASSEDLIESLGPLSSSNGSDTCNTPGCIHKGKPSYKGLCLNCYFNLSRQMPKPSKKRRDERLHLQPSVSSPCPCKLPAHRCKTLGCSMFGTEPNMGYCSHCFSKYKELMKDEDRLQRLQQMNEAERMRHLPLDRTTIYPRSCVTCDRPGRPDYRGFCVVCAEARGMFCHGEPGVSSYPRPVHMEATENSTGETARALVTDLNAAEYKQVMSEVEKSCRTSHAKCKNIQCVNYANLRRDGYCNQCYSNFH